MTCTLMRHTHERHAYEMHALRYMPVREALP
jgi:hypothetical protein